MYKITNTIIINLFYVYEYLLRCMYVYQRHAGVTVEARRGVWVPWKWN